MTREEAINTLGNLRRYMSGGGAVDLSINKAIDMAISALKDEPLSHEEAWAEIESDLIRREDAIQALLSHFIPQTYTGDDVAHADRLARKIMGAIPSADRPTDGDLISRADAIERVELITKCEWDNNVIYRDEVIDALKFAPSADAGPTVIRSRTFMRAEDFEKWAKRIRETNPNAVVIPCDAEIVSAEAVQLKQTDTLIIADALRYLAQDEERHLSDRTRADALREQILKYGASMCHSAEADRPHGEWNRHELFENPWYTCSVCNYHGRNDFNFCPNCGAKMSKGGDDE